MNDNERTMESGATASGYPGWDIEPVVEQIWSDLGGTVARPEIRRELAQVIPAFKDARMTTYVPLFVRRRTVERLQNGSSGVTPGEHVPEAAEATEPARSAVRSYESEDPTDVHRQQRP